MPHFDNITTFLKNPRNRELRDLYADAADEIRQKIFAYRGDFESIRYPLRCFLADIAHVIHIVQQNAYHPSLAAERRSLLLNLIVEERKDLIEANTNQAPRP